ncbi:DUF7168 domain-containing protein [Neisseria yangbaofengii]|uniref:DUF7168 domain-containing protein n=1 Tax=Neisseria yangbaofengii TaxID=2709396 RepID=UPI0013ED93C1|nr:DUF2786 domain-containing protein [Neisseria yangbaofengii]
MDKEKALDKIKKCLALSKSANEHEAAQALKQAQALMKKFELTEAEIGLSEISEEMSDRKVALKLAKWQWNVAHLVADVFGCGYYKRGNCMHFYGFGNRPQVAAYAFDVVWRQIAAARRKYLRECPNIIPSRREYLANRYCEGWLTGARRAVQMFAYPEGQEQMMERYAENALKIKMVKPRTISAPPTLKNIGDDAEYSGMQDGREIELYHAMDGGEAKKMIGARP